MMKKINLNKFSNIYALLLVISVVMSSCLPQPTQVREAAPTVDSNSSNNTGTDTNNWSAHRTNKFLPTRKSEIHISNKYFF